MANQPTEKHESHEIECYVSVQKRLNSMYRGGDIIPVKTKTPLSNVLTKLSNSPAISFTATCCGRFHSPIADITLSVDGEDAGTFGNPNVEKIVEKSKPSPFGRGDKTVMDLTYRNGREIVADDLVIGAAQDNVKGALYKLIETHISESLFVDKLVKIKLYKLALYGKEGHFDWHRDTTHGDDHHATVLVALNTEWTGGSLGLRHEGKTVEVDMHPEMRTDEESEETSDESSDEGDPNEPKKVEDKPRSQAFQIIAFYTDVEHKVENITDGTRIVLQFDVNVNVSEDNSEDHEDGLLSRSFGQNVSNTMKALFPVLAQDTSRDAILDELAAMIKELHTSKSLDTVVFPLRHLYRVASIKPEYLKGVDGYVYEALKKSFDVILKPIVLIEPTDDEGCWSGENTHGVPFVSKHSEESTTRPKKKRKVEQKSEIHVPGRYELIKLSSTSYIEHTGNESQAGEDCYFGGGMFVAAKGRAA